jgi:hypothetical protein
MGGNESRRMINETNKAYTGRLVFAAGDAVRPVLAQLEIGNHVSVSTLVAVDLIS